MLRYESATVRRFHHIVAVSEEDRAQLAKMTIPSRISVCPTGVDLQRYRFAAPPVSPRQYVVFLGSMDWEANIDGVDSFTATSGHACLRRCQTRFFRSLAEIRTPECAGSPVGRSK